MNVKLTSLLLSVALLLVVNAKFEVPATEDVFVVTEYGAKGDGSFLNQDAIRKTFDACRAHGGTDNLIIFPYFDGNMNVYLTGPFNISCNHTVVWIDEGVEIRATKKAPWPVVTGPLPIKGWRYQPVVYGTFVHHVTIAGGGIINGQGSQWWPDHPSGLSGDQSQLYLPDLIDENENDLSPPRLMACVWCNRFDLRDITLYQSPFWTYTPFYSSNLLVDNITIWNPIDSPNTDCVDPASVRHMVIKRSKFSCGDDAITVKAYAPSDFIRPDISKPPVDPEGFPWRSENITIENNEFFHGQGLVIGAGLKGGIFDIKYRHNIVRGALCGMRFKAVRDYAGYTERIFYEHNHFDSVGILLSVNSDFDHHDPPENSTHSSPVLRDITVHNTTGWGISSVVMNCVPESPCDGWKFSDWSWTEATQAWMCKYASGTLSGYVGPPVCDSFS